MDLGGEMTAIVGKKMSSCRGGVGRERSPGQRCSAMLSAAAGKAKPRDGDGGSLDGDRAAGVPGCCSAVPWLPKSGCLGEIRQREKPGLTEH